MSDVCVAEYELAHERLDSEVLTCAGRHHTLSSSSIPLRLVLRDAIGISAIRMQLRIFLQQAKDNRGLLAWT